MDRFSRWLIVFLLVSIIAYFYLIDSLIVVPPLLWWGASIGATRSLFSYRWIWCTHVFVLYSLKHLKRTVILCRME